MNSDNLMQQVREALNGGLSDEAVQLAKKRNTRDCLDPEFHLAWADILEDLDLVDEVILELNLAIRDAPDRFGAYVRLAEVYLDQGHPNRAARVWSQLVLRQPTEPRYYEDLGSAYREANEYEKAKDCYLQGLEKTGDVRFKGLLKDLTFLEKPDQDRAQPSEDGAQLVPQRHHLVAFTSLFASREGVYARQWVSPTGESGYTPVQEPLTFTVAENHILGNYTIGAYPVRLDNTVNYLAFDLDVAKFAVAKAISSERAWRGLMEKVHKLACRLVDIGAAHELCVYIEDSGFKGRHCWIFPETPIPAGVAKKCGDLLLGLLSPLPPEITVEVFPKQTSVRKGGLGNLIKLPLGIHKKTGKRAVFLDPDGTPYPNQLDFMDNITRASRRAIYGFIQRIHAGLGASTQTVAQTAQPFPEHDRDEEPPFDAAEPALPKVEAPYDPDRDPEFQQIMLKCPVLHGIVAKVNQTAALSKEETLVLIHTIGHLKNGPEAVNVLFQKSINADPALFLKSRLRGNPMSCPKIRARIPELTSTVACNCIFDLDSNLYPSPLIHIRSFSGTETPTPLGITVDSLQFQNLLEDYLKLRKQFRETKMLMDRYEERLTKFFEEAGVESVQTPLGQLRISKNDQGVSFSLEI